MGHAEGERTVLTTLDGAPPSSPGDPVEEVLDLLRARGGRVTTSRRVLLGALFGGEVHRTAEELAKAVHEVTPDVHLSTIYRNLDELEGLGVVVHAHLGHGPATYHLASEMHGHLVCEVCDTTVEAPPELFRELAADARRRYGFVIDPRHFAVLGRCASCVAQEDPPG
ncbi:MAG: Fur family transcriptional regulator [Acidimicrobiales bacterium]